MDLRIRHFVQMLKLGWDFTFPFLCIWINCWKANFSRTIDNWCIIFITGTILTKTMEIPLSRLMDDLWSVLQGHMNSHLKHYLPRNCSADFIQISPGAFMGKGERNLFIWFQSFDQDGWQSNWFKKPLNVNQWENWNRIFNKQ